mmetsp:Transcript_22302/g.33207  ORF Transcript_22302/g.33207 Transcript_22302/m.33207 type:complete len:108 (-) Transcript_22302:195-518(-)|eukprot:CAMPEP_0194046098 /NCGR_PEP_ID=MMETSP0009_2-20130614/19463_1 /TAXON_ID=210454 /ORGANISM="Grammatophora oceanica, Strain CCMP 410" /LENGTH=107 /DNA_ID=CAMNT_0038691245 /DNA_START=38 /DNA_END=361 /DNA_ORIENTATION=+
MTFTSCSKTVIFALFVALLQVSTVSAFSFGPVRAPIMTSFAAIKQQHPKRSRNNNKRQKQAQEDKTDEAAARTSLLEYNALCSRIIEEERSTARMHYLTHIRSGNDV